MSVAFSAVFRDGVIVPDWKLDLVEGKEYVVVVDEITHEERERMIAEHRQQAEKAAKRQD